MKNGMKLDVPVTSSPHIGSPVNTKSIMLDVIIALIPAGLAGIYYFGSYASSVICVSVLSCVLFEYLWHKLMKKPNTTGDLSAAVTGLLLAYSLPPTIPLWIVVIGALFSIIIVKQLFGGLGHNFVNPALSGRAFLIAAWASQMTKWVTPSIFGTDAVSTATPLEYLKTGAGEIEPLMDVFLGNVGGCIGETSAALLIIGGLYLMVRRIISPRIPLTYLATVFVLIFLCGNHGEGSALEFTLYHMCSGALMLGAFFMATDYVTSPVTKWGQIIMGIGCGVITVLIRLKGGYPEGVTYAILLMNVATPLIDKYTQPRVFGHMRKKEAKAQ